MASKRIATSDLNHENWNTEDEPEEAGTFSIASKDVLEKRIVRTAKRRLGAGEGPGATKNAFGSFSGFKTTPTATTAAFSFLKSNPTPIISSSSVPKLPSMSSPSNGSVKSPENGLSTSSVPAMHLKPTSDAQKTPPKGKTETIFKESSEYFAKLKGLNEGVAQWIKTHVDANPYCILTPIFRDYDSYLKEIEAKREEQRKKTEMESSKLAAKPTLTFGAASKDIVSASETKLLEKTLTPTGPMFGSGTPAKSPFASEAKSGSDKESNPFLKSVEKSDKPAEKDEELEKKVEAKAAMTFAPVSGTFSFGQSSSTGSTSFSGFSFGSGKPFSFGSGVMAPPADSKEDKEEEKEDEDEPPKVEIKPVTEEGAIYEKRCKVFFKKEGVYSDRGIGIIFLKPTPNGKTQLIVRAENSLGNLLINTLLTESIRTQRMNKNTVMVMCLPLPDSQPPPVPVLLRVKTSEDADDLLEALDSNKK